jgi:hypothetical protein
MWMHFQTEKSETVPRRQKGHSLWARARGAMLSKCRNSKILADFWVSLLSEKRSAV